MEKLILNFKGDKDMNIYEKITNITLDFQKKKVKKSGQNKYAGYQYFELGDIVPPLNELMAKYKVTMKINYDKEQAQMDLINSEKPEDRICYFSPMADVSLKGAHAIQNLGAQQTYIRRYFLMTAFNIVENDYYDAIQGKEEEEKKELIKEINLICQEKIKSGKTREEIIKETPEIKILKNMGVSDLRRIKERVGA